MTLSSKIINYQILGPLKPRSKQKLYYHVSLPYPKNVKCKINKNDSINLLTACVEDASLNPLHFLINQT